MDRQYRLRGEPYLPSDAPSYQSYPPVNVYPNPQSPASYGSPPTPPDLTSVLDSVPLGTDQENSKLLDLVDKLRECRVDQFIDLPLVVAVGDQSSGKSSVLEAITQIPFPRDSIQCTRFATEIRLRRDTSKSKTTTKVSIIAYNRAKDQQRYDQFEQTVDEGFDIAEIFRRASELIFQGDSKGFLSRDILRIERTGPRLSHLTIVDLPGIIHNPTNTQTTDDVDAIATLSKTYMSKQRTIILPIVGCDVEYAKQVIVRRCKEVDPTGIRTLGVITKPDMTLTEAREEMFIDLACNKDERNTLQLGWHVLRNRAHNEMDFTTEERNAEEQKFFANSKWGARLDPSQLGVEALLQKLSTQLIRHIATEVFKVKDEIEMHLEQCNGRLKEMGPGLDTVEQMRQELNNLCKRSASLTREAVQGQGINPPGDNFFPHFNQGTKRDARNLRSRVVILNEYFCESMERRGAAYTMEGAPGHQQPVSTSNSHFSQPGATPPFSSRKDFIEKEVRPLIQDNPGQELSVDINPLLVYPLFQQYSRNWPGLADQHITAVQNLCDEFLTEVMAHAWPRRLQNRIWRGFVRQATKARLKRAWAELENLKRDRCRYVKTYHSSFVEKYHRQGNSPHNQGEHSPHNKYENTLNKMLLHYEHQLPTFISNVITQVVERHLIDGMEEVFESERVRSLKDVEVRQLMEEDYGTQTERKKLVEKREILQNGLDICREIATRPDLGPYEYQDPKLLSQAGPMLPPRRPQDQEAARRRKLPTPNNSAGITSSQQRPSTPPSWQETFYRPPNSPSGGPPPTTPGSISPHRLPADVLTDRSRAMSGGISPTQEAQSVAHQSPITQPPTAFSGAEDEDLERAIRMSLMDTQDRGASGVPVAPQGSADERASVHSQNSRRVSKGKHGLFRRPAE